MLDTSSISVTMSLDTKNGLVDFKGVYYLRRTIVCFFKQLQIEIMRIIRKVF